MNLERFGACTILCTGEGLPRVRPSDLLPGPVIAVNRAIVPSALWAGGTPVPPDVWTCQDAPNCSIRYFSPEVRARPWGDNLPPTVWTRRSRVEVFAKAYPALTIEPQPDGKAFSERIPWESESTWCKYTVLGAITEAIMRGARRIRVIGADMGGIGYSTDAGGVGDVPEGDSGKEWRDRWEEERAHFFGIVAECAAHGITVERVLAADMGGWKRLRAEGVSAPPG